MNVSYFYLSEKLDSLKTLLKLKYEKKTVRIVRID